MPIKFHLDENVHPAIAAGLRSHGIDVTTSQEAGLLRADDGSHLEFAAAQERVLVTHDADFLMLHAQGASHAGIAFAHQLKYPVGELLQMLLLLHEVYRAEDMSGQLEFL